MAIHPNVAQTLRAEVLEHCGPTACPTFEHFRDMKYSCVLEVIREIDVFIYFIFYFSESRDKRNSSFVPSSTSQHPRMSLYTMHLPPIRSNISQHFKSTSIHAFKDCHNLSPSPDAPQSCFMGSRCGRFRSRTMDRSKTYKEIRV